VEPPAEAGGTENTSSNGSPPENPQGRRFNQNPALSRMALAVIGAAVSVACFRTGFLFFFFLVPLALSSFLGDAKTTWAAGILTIAFSVIFSLWFYMYRGADPVVEQWNNLYFVILVIFFTWINAPLGGLWVFREIIWRMIAGSLLCTLLLSPFFLSIINNPHLRLVMERQIEAFGSPDWSGFLTTDEFLSRLVYLGLRGGILITSLFLWWVNRQFALLICRLIRRNYGNTAGNFPAFRVPNFFIWIFSFSLGAVLLGKIGKTELLEIGGWNILILSATLFFIQGGAVSLYFLSRLPPLPRIIINVGIIFLFFKSGINLAILGLLIILGIADNWVLFRNPKQ